MTFLFLEILGYILILVLNIVCMLIVTMIIAALTLIERKVLSLIQRRVGPSFVGYKGRLQYIADALKLFIKGVLIPDLSNKFWYITIPSILAAICYSFWMNSMWGPSLSLFEIEYNVVYASLISILFSFCILLTGYFSKNKYAIIGSIRCALLVLNLELFLGLLTLNLVLITESFCFSVFVIYQELFWFFILFFGLLGIIILIFLLETNRAPFDLPEAETELVAGYFVEFGGFYFGIYYLGEYLHLFFFSSVISILLFGGWELPIFFFTFSKYYYNFFKFDNILIPLFYDFYYKYTFAFAEVVHL